MYTEVKTTEHGDLLIIGVDSKSAIKKLKTEQFNSLFNLPYNFSPWLDRGKLLPDLQEGLPEEVTDVLLAEVKEQQDLSTFIAHATAIDAANR